MSINKKLYRSGPYADLFSQGVQVGNALYMAGQVGVDEHGAAPEELLEQMSQAYGHMQEVKKLPTRAIQVRRISTPKIYHLGMKMNIMTIETGNVFPGEQAQR